MKKILVLFALICAFGHINAQETENSGKGWKVSAFYVSLGSSSVWLNNSSSSYETLKGEVDDPSLFVDPNDFSNVYFGSQSSGGFSPKMQIGITPYCKKKGKLNYNREIRIGIGSNRGTRQTYSFYDDENYVIDTFYSTNGNPNIYMDSTWNTNYNYYQEIIDLNFSASFIFKTDIQKRIHFYAGVGVEYAFTLNYYVSVDHYDGYTINTSTDVNNSNNYPYGGYYDQYYYGTTNYSTNSTNMKNSAQFLRTYLPLGINFRFSNNSSFWKHANIYTEFNPGVEFQFVKGEENQMNAYFGMAVVGLSYKW